MAERLEDWKKVVLVFLAVIFIAWYFGSNPLVVRAKMALEALNPLLTTFMFAITIVLLLGRRRS